MLQHFVTVNTKHARDKLMVMTMVMLMMMMIIIISESSFLACVLHQYPVHHFHSHIMLIIFFSITGITIVVMIAKNMMNIAKNY